MILDKSFGGAELQITRNGVPLPGSPSDPKARLNAAASVTGTLTELNVIAAAVIGGTSLGGGIGTVIGAVIGAVIMQSLENGMVLMGVPTPLQKIVVGIVLVLAVWVDVIYRRQPT